MLPDELLLEARGLQKHFPVRQGWLQRVVGHVKAVDGVDLSVKRGETLGLVGESGSGKSTTGRALLRLLPPTGGEVWFRSRALARDGDADTMVSVTDLNRRDMKVLRQDMQFIFQDPYSSLDPRMPIGEIVAEPLRVRGILNRGEREDRVAVLLKAVGLAAEYAKRFPHELSGGQRQRIGIARALPLNPSFIVADEPVSALDVSTQAQVVNLLQDLQAELGLAYLFIAHDLSIVRHISNRVAVMYLGKIVEIADVEDLFLNPKHPYTEALLSAIPVADPDFVGVRIRLKGDPPSPMAPPPGCPFHPRCAYAMSQCSVEAPTMRRVAPAHEASCHFVAELNLRGVDALRG